MGITINIILLLFDTRQTPQAKGKKGREAKHAAVS
jgi:hypothetical protein